eukprot:11156-Heterococcus_DN1.PRE.1
MQQVRLSAQSDDCNSKSTVHGEHSAAVYFYNVTRFIFGHYCVMQTATNVHIPRQSQSELSSTVSTDATNGQPVATCRSIKQYCSKSSFAALSQLKDLQLHMSYTDEHKFGAVKPM